MSVKIKPITFGTDNIGIEAARKKALQLISAFRMDKSIADKSTHYLNIRKNETVEELKSVINFDKHLAQESSSLCGPAAFFFDISRKRPDIYVNVVLDLYKNGEAKLEKLKLKSSSAAKKAALGTIKGIDWMVMSSIKPWYDEPADRVSGITWPATIESWLYDTGYYSIVNNTNLITSKSLDVLLQVQNAYASGYSVFLLVDANVFRTFIRKGKKSMTANHWVVLNSNIKIKKYDQKLKSHKAPAILSRTLVTAISGEMEDYEDAMEEFNEEEGFSENEPIEIDNQILLDVFTWGERRSPVYGEISKSRKAKLSYFLNGFYGYVKAKR